jgi:molybdopterin converting factor small subunit
MTGRQEVRLPDGATIADLIRHLEVDEQLVCMVAVNGRAAEPETLLADGDSVDLIPPITGGGKHHTFRGGWA